MCRKGKETSKKRHILEENPKPKNMYIEIQ